MLSLHCACPLSLTSVSQTLSFRSEWKNSNKDKDVKDEDRLHQKDNLIQIDAK